jgi:hypothetical protein
VRKTFITCDKCQAVQGENERGLFRQYGANDLCPACNVLMQEMVDRHEKEIKEFWRKA